MRKPVYIFLSKNLEFFNFGDENNIKQSGPVKLSSLEGCTTYTNNGNSVKDLIILEKVQRLIDK